MRSRLVVALAVSALSSTGWTARHLAVTAAQQVTAPVAFAVPPAPVPPAVVGQPFVMSFCSPAMFGPNDLCGGIDRIRPQPVYVTGGMPPYHFILDTMGNFPPFGLILHPNGVLNGVPRAAGARAFRVCAVDMKGDSACINYVLNVLPRQQQPQAEKRPETQQPPPAPARTEAPQPQYVPILRKPEAGGPIFDCDGAPARYERLRQMLPEERRRVDEAKRRVEAARGDLREAEAALQDRLKEELKSVRDDLLEVIKAARPELAGAIGDAQEAVEMKEKIEEAIKELDDVAGKWAEDVTTVPASAPTAPRPTQAAAATVGAGEVRPLRDDTLRILKFLDEEGILDKIADRLIAKLKRFPTAGLQFRAAKLFIDAAYLDMKKELEMWEAFEAQHYLMLMEQQYLQHSGQAMELQQVIEECNRIAQRKAAAQAPPPPPPQTTRPPKKTLSGGAAAGLTAASVGAGVAVYYAAQQLATLGTEDCGSPPQMPSSCVGIGRNSAVCNAWQSDYSEWCSCNGKTFNVSTGSCR